MGDPGAAGGRVRVLFFGTARDACGLGETAVPCRPGMSLEDLMDELLRMHPGLSALRAHIRFARNGEFARMGDAVAPGDEVAVIPPVSGG